MLANSTYSLKLLFFFTVHQNTVNHRLDGHRMEDIRGQTIKYDDTTFTKKKSYTLLVADRTQSTVAETV